MKRLAAAAMAAALLGLCAWAAWAADGEPGVITKEELAKLLGDPSVVIYDVRTGTGWRASGFKIQGAQRLEPSLLDEWVLPEGKKLVFY